MSGKDTAETVGQGRLLAVQKPTCEEYLAQHSAELCLPASKSYELNLNLIQKAISDGPFLRGLGTRLLLLRNEYSAVRPNLLFGHKIPDLDLLLKPFGSAMEKVYRHNVVFNKAFPAQPKEGWIDGTNLYSRLNDIIRGTIVCKYLDGPPFVCGKLKTYGDELGIACRFYPMNTERGYHSWHFYASHNVEFFDDKGGVQMKPVELEIQITTQLADVMTTLTHELYKGERVLPKGQGDDTWKWSPDSPRFRSTYTGHTLHLVESIILALKNEVVAAQAEGKEPKK